jgi:uncharacterized protein YciI
MQFVIIARDGTDNEALGRRMAAREAHLVNMKKLKTDGHYVIGGPFLDDKESMIGSIVIVDFADRAGVDNWLANDPYTKGNVWQQIEVLPFRNAGVATPSKT